MSTSLVVREVTDSVAKTVRRFVENCQLTLPENYSAENALKSALLILQDLKVNKMPMTETCSRASIENSLLSMVIQGLNPDKKQGYFIAYGSILTFQRSYFGNMALAKRLDPEIKDIFADVVYQGDIFEYEKSRGVTRIVKHTQKIDNVKRENILAAYAIIVYRDDREVTTIMTIAEIMEAWKQSSAKPIDDKGALKSDSVHYKFMEEMCKKTVTSRACKPIINSSDDSNLVVRYAKKSDDDAAAAEVEQEISENANKKTIEVDFTDINEDTGEVIAKDSDPF
jgi:recombination protein RecT